MIRRAPLPALLVAASLSGCGGDDPRALHEAGRSLVPEPFSVIHEVESSCVPGEDSPSCVIVYFATGAASQRERIRLVAETARDRDWMPAERPRVEEATTVTYERGRYLAFVRLWERGRSWRRACRGRSGVEWITLCADSVQVLRR